jgi:hypothetical protein
MGALSKAAKRAAASYVKRKIKKVGLKGVVIWVLDTYAKSTPSKKDDEIVAELKKMLNKLK